MESVVQHMNKKTIGIITFHSQYNCGSALQAVALQDAVEKLGFTCKIINYYYEKDMKSYYIRFYKHDARVIVFDLFLLPKNILQHHRYKQFQRTYMHLTPRVKTPEGVSEQIENFSVIICGSDQIWNLNVHDEIEPVYFMTIKIGKQKTIAYAPSMGGSIKKIGDENFKDRFTHAIMNFDYLSAREDKLRTTLSLLTGKEIMQVLDPTLLFDSDYYDQLIADYQLQLPKKYLFCYCLWGNHKKSIIKYAVTYARNHHLKIVYYSKNRFWGSDFYKNIYAKGPLAFIYAIKNADFVISDSFHACVFSILFQKKFKTYAEDSKRNRMDSLFDLLGIKGCFFGEENYTEEIDYNVVNLILEAERRKSWEFLKQSLSENDKR